MCNLLDWTKAPICPCAKRSNYFALLFFRITLAEKCLSCLLFLKCMIELIKSKGQWCTLMKGCTFKALFVWTGKNAESVVSPTQLSSGPILMTVIPIHTHSFRLLLVWTIDVSSVFYFINAVCLNFRKLWLVLKRCLSSLKYRIQGELSNSL